MKIKDLNILIFVLLIGGIVFPFYIRTKQILEIFNGKDVDGHRFLNGTLSIIDTRSKEYLPNSNTLIFNKMCDIDNMFNLYNKLKYIKYHKITISKTREINNYPLITDHGLVNNFFNNTLNLVITDDYNEHLVFLNKKYDDLWDDIIKDEDYLNKNITKVFYNNKVRSIVVDENNTICYVSNIRKSKGLILDDMDLCFNTRHYYLISTFFTYVLTIFTTCFFKFR